MNTPTLTKSATAVNNNRDNEHPTSCPQCFYALYPATGKCSNFECAQYHRQAAAISFEQLIHRFQPPRLFHGRRWGSWTLDCERLALVFDASPIDRGEYVGFFGHYELDLERIRQSSNLLDFIFQVRGKAWATSVVMRDLIEAIDDILAPQASLCSGGGHKVIADPAKFLQHRIATVGTDGPMRDAA